MIDKAAKPLRETGIGRGTPSLILCHAEETVVKEIGGKLNIWKLCMHDRRGITGWLVADLDGAFSLVVRELLSGGGSLSLRMKAGENEEGKLHGAPLEVVLGCFSNLPHYFF